MTDSTKRPLKRATNWDEFQAVRSGLRTKEGVAYTRAFQPRSTDVVISPFAKCGTTWMQQIVHALRTGGDTDYDDISRVVPWIETAHGLGIDLNEEQRAKPRAFKSHLSYHDIPKGARYIVVLRHPQDALVSLYRFMEGWFFEPGAVSLEEFARRSWFDREHRQDYFTHLLSWWPKRKDPDLLLLTFEDMKADHGGTVARVGEFLGTPKEHVGIAIHNSTLHFMKEHAHQFDDLMMREFAQRSSGLPSDGNASKVRDGQVGKNRLDLPLLLIEELDQLWRLSVLPATGHTDYNALRGALS